MSDTQTELPGCRTCGGRKYALRDGLCPLCAMLSGNAMMPEEFQPFIDPATNEPYKLCRDCHGWGTVTTTYPGGLMNTEDCRRCAGTGEEIS